MARFEGEYRLFLGEVVCFSRTTRIVLHYGGLCMKPFLHWSLFVFFVIAVISGVFFLVYIRPLVGWDGVPPGEWITVRAGTFTMGSPEDEVGRWSYFERQHEVTLSTDFLMLTTEVREADFMKVMGYSTFNPRTRLSCHANAGRCYPDCPIRAASWHHGAAYCNALSAGQGLSLCYDCSGERFDVTCTPSARHESPYECPGFRLPTEAEWEYAARGGTTTATYGGDFTIAMINLQWNNPVLAPIAWISTNSGGSTRAVGSLRPNAYGLYDMLGNESEWCHDWFGTYPDGAVTDPWGAAEGQERAHRGGNAGSPASQARSASREKAPPEYRPVGMSFRPVRSLLPDPQS
jgi:formylglycine-generating enzyme